jgi:hypothetical protein
VTEQFLYEWKVYGEGGGVMFSSSEHAASADVCAITVARRYAGWPQAASVQVWPANRSAPPVYEPIARRGETYQ